MSSGRRAILLVSESYWPTIDGGALFERRLAHALRIRGWSVYVWSPSPTGQFWVQDDGGVLTIRESSRKLRANPRYRISVFPFMNTSALFRLAKPHVVHIHNFGPLGLEALRYAKLRGIPTVMTNHNLPQNWTANLFHRSTPKLDLILEKLFRRLLDLTCVVVSPSNTADRYVASTGVTTERVVISNGIDTDFFHPSCDTSDAFSNGYPLRLIHVGRLDREKSCEVVVAAAARASLDRKLTLTVVGDGIQRPNLTRQVHRLEASGQSEPGAIRFLGSLSELAKRKALQSSNLFVTASQAELQGIAALESMACGVGVLAPNAGALPELCRPGQTGLLFQAGRAEDCARQLCMVDLSHLRTLGTGARAVATREHDARMTYEKYDRLLNSIRSQKTIKL